MIAAWVLALVAQAPAETLTVRTTTSSPSVAGPAPAGPPSVRIPTAQGGASIWLLRTADSAYVVARIPDSTYYWGDDLVVSLDVEGDSGASPGHDDFQWYLRRALDSSVVFRGRAGRWEAPRGDPDWRLGREREGGGWKLDGMSDRGGWTLVLRLDRAWLAGDAGRPPRIAFRVYDDSPSGWYAWPGPAPGKQASGVERVPDLWGVVLLSP